MLLRFILNPHTKNIIVGRKGSPIICSDKKCGKEIIVTGQIKCPRCPNTIVNYPEDLGEVNVDKQIATSLICPACKKDIPLKDNEGNFVVTWTQEVVSKHRHNKHDYYHKKHWEDKFIGSDE
jgi:hypothetical protein